MTQTEYEQKKLELYREITEQESWCGLSIASFESIFDRAYALGKQEKDADEQDVLTCEKRKVLYRFRMAEACKIGNNPETDYWIGYSKAIQDLFGLEGEPYVTPNEADTVINGWVARDATRHLYIYDTKPARVEWCEAWECAGFSLPLNDGLFPDLTWDYDPIEVELIIKRKNNGRV